MAITIRLTEEQEKIIDSLKFTLNQKSTSKALLIAAKVVPEMKDKIYEHQEEIRNLKYELKTIKDLILEKNNIAKRLIDIIEL